MKLTRFQVITTSSEESFLKVGSEKGWGHDNGGDMVVVTPGICMGQEA